MIYREFKRQLGKAGISCKEFSELVRLNPNSLSNYSNKGEVPTHWAIVVTLLGEMAEQGLDFKEVLKRMEITPKKSRGTTIANKNKD